MTLSLHNLQPARGSRRAKRRVGRGNASGSGTYSGRGLKGQRSRSGGKKKLKRKGIKTLLQSKQKIGGFRSYRAKPATVNLKQLDAAFSGGAVVDAERLLDKGLIDSSKAGVKILGDGALTKPLTIIADAFSEAAKSGILEAGGKVQLKPKKAKPKVKRR